jgi:ubiquinone/menaquinone biosynthesis C-methylase UbiE
MPIPNDIQDHYGVPPEHYWNEDYFQVSDGAYAHDLERFKKLADYRPGLKFLDVGAGVGKQMVAYERMGFDVYGFEPSKPFHERAISKMGIAPEKLKLAQVEDVDYPEAEFDFISFGVVLEHLYHPSYCLSRALTWLKPGGLIHIEVPSADWLINKLVNRYYRLRGTDYVANLSPMHPPYHLYEYSLESFQKNGLTNGYEVVHHDRYVCPTYMPKILDGVMRKYMKATGKGMQLSVWLRKNP